MPQLGARQSNLRRPDAGEAGREVGQEGGIGDTDMREPRLMLQDVIHLSHQGVLLK